jgi:DNA-binding YbaB/EbfC family protein
MFDQLKGLSALAGLLKDLPRIRAKADSLRRELGEVRVSGESGGGAVRATADGLMRIMNVEVDPALLGGLVDPSSLGDRTMAEQLVAEAVNAALAAARERVDSELADAAAELGLPIPPGALGGLLKP